MKRHIFLRAAAFGLLLLVLIGLNSSGQAAKHSLAATAFPLTAEKIAGGQGSTIVSLALPAHKISLQQNSSLVGGAAGRNNSIGTWKPFAPISFILDDGSQETVFGLNIYYHGIPLIAINRFTPNPGDFPFTINQISIQFPNPANANGDLTGRNIDLLVYEDPTGSGDPTNASKVYQQPFTIQVADGVSFSNYPVYIPVQGPGDVYIGFSNTYDHGNQTPYTYPVPIDRSASQQRSWIATNVSGADPDYNDLANNAMLSLIDNIGYYLAGNFVIHASAESGTSASPTPPIATNTPTPTNTPPSGLTITPTSTPTIGPPCGAIFPTSSVVCSSPSTYNYSFSFYIESGCISSVTGPATLTFEVATNPGGPFILFDQQVRQVTFPAGPDYVTFTGTLTETNIPLQYTSYYIGFNAASVEPNAYAQSQPATLCSNVTPTITPIRSVTAVITTTATPTTPGDTTTPTITAIPTSCTLIFSDVPQGSTFYPFVRCLACRGILGGYPDGTFKPNNNVTRGQLSKIVSNAAGFSDNQATQTFQDVPIGSTFFQYIGRLASRSYISGYACGGPDEPCQPGNLPYFRPNNHSTRGQISKIVSNAAGFNDAPGGQQFEDVAVGSTYYTYTYRLVSRTIMSGYQCGSPGERCVPPGNLPYFRPNNNATRGQTSKIVANAFFPDCQTPGTADRVSMLQLRTLNSAPAVAAPPPPQWPLVVLYDQYDHISINTTNSQNYEPALGTYSDFLADDIVVGAGQTWTIDEVDVAGAMVGNGQADSFNVALYTDAGLPGTIVYTATNLAYTIPVQGEHAIPLTTPAVVGPGTYYLMVQANHPSIYAGGGEWGWYNRGLQFNHPAAWINPGNGWGTSCNEDTGWGVRWTCQGDSPNPDQVWRVLGSIGGSATNTPTSVTTTPTATNSSTPVNTIPVLTITLTTPPTSVSTTATTTPPTVVPTTSCCNFSISNGASDCASYETYHYTFDVQLDCSSWFGTLVVYFEASASAGGPWTVVDQTQPQTVYGTSQINDTFIEHSVPSQYLYYRVRAGISWEMCLHGGYVEDSTAPSTLCPNPASTTTPTITVTPTSCTLSFTDVPQGSTFYPFVRCLACRGILGGYPDGTFKPNNNVTRGQLSKIVSNAAGFSDNQATQTFQDVPIGSTFFQYVGRLASRGYIGGYQCGGPGEQCVPPDNLPYFRPGNHATRGQISKIVSNAAGFNDAPGGQQFEDVAVGSTYYTYTYRLVSRTIMSGYQCGGVGEPCNPPGNLPYFRPNNNATRGQTSKIVANAFFPGCQTPAGTNR